MFVAFESSSDKANASVQLFREACSSFHHRQLNVAVQYRGETERKPGFVCRSTLRIPRRSARSPVANALRNDARYQELSLREPSNKRNARIVWRCDTMRCFPCTEERLASSWGTRENSRPDAPKKQEVSVQPVSLTLFRDDRKIK